jgi:hypothetical protein
VVTLLFGVAVTSQFGAVVTSLYRLVVISLERVVQKNPAERCELAVDFTEDVKICSLNVVNE